MSLKTIHTDKAPKAVGPYSQAVCAGSFVFLAGQVPLDPVTGKIVEGGIKNQTRRVMENIKEVLKKAGCDFNNVVKAEVYLADLNDYAAVNEVYAEYFSEHKPARIALQVAKLPLDSLVEISVTAYNSGKVDFL